MASVDIGQVVARSGVPASTLRYYESRGLIASCGRSGGRRQFDEQVVQKLALISLGQAAGFSLDDIKAMFDQDGEPQIDRAALLAKADEIDEAITKLSAARDLLNHAANCGADRHMECPSFLSLVEMAGAGAFGRLPAI